MDKKQLHSTDDELIGILILIPLFFGSWLLVTSMAEVVPGLGVYDGKRLLELYLIPLTLSLTLFSLRARLKLNEILKATPRLIRILVPVFFVLGIISALLTPHPAYPLTDVAMLFLLLVTAISVACTKQLTGKKFDRLILVFLAMMGIGVVFQDLIGLLVYLSTDQQFSFRESLFHFLHPRFYNQVQTWTIPLLALLPMVFNKYRWMSLLSTILVGAQWYIILSNGARGSALSLLLAMLIVGMVLPASRKFWVKIHAFGLVLGILFYSSVVGLVGEAQPSNTDFFSKSMGRPMFYSTGRVDLWKHALDDAIQNPFLGTGPMRYACEVDHYLPGSPHSFPLQIMSEWGIPAFLILGILFSWLVYIWIKQAKPIRQESDYKQVLVACLSISCLAAIIHVCVSGLLISPSSQVVGMLVAGWLLGSLFTKGYGAPTTTSTGKLSTTYLFLFGLMVAVSVSTFATSELDELPFRTSYAQDYGPITPRFWQDGRFCEYSF